MGPDGSSLCTKDPATCPCPQSHKFSPCLKSSNYFTWLSTPSYHVVQNITNGPSWSNWRDMRRKTKKIESGWKHLSYPWEQTVKIFKMEAQLNILPARMYENVWHTWLQEDAHMLGLKALECTPHTKVSGFMLATSDPVCINQWGITGRNSH
jgi:hypothetical protein